MQVAKTTNRIEQIKKRNLSIQFSLDGFSFCIKNEHDEILDFEKKNFNKTLTSAENLLVEIEGAFRNTKELQVDFDDIFVVHENNLSTLVPNDFFDENELKSYLDFTIKTLANDYITFDDLESISAKNIYIPYVNINNYLFQNFGEFAYQHHKSVLIDKLLQEHSGEKLYVNVNKSTFDLILLKENNLIFCNSFLYNTTEDFMYFLLFSIEQLKLDVHQISLVLLGEIYQKSKLYETITQFIENVSFLKTKNTLQKNNSESHMNYILLG